MSLPAKPKLLTEQVEIMAGIKSLLDPNWILNPNKVINVKYAKVNQTE